MKTSLRDVIIRSLSTQKKSRKEWRVRKAPNISSSPSTDEDDLDNGRLENRHWCKCGECIIFWRLRYENVVVVKNTVTYFGTN